MEHCYCRIINIYRNYLLLKLNDILSTLKTFFKVRQILKKRSASNSKRLMNNPPSIKIE
jgi:hypothetical protein